MAIKISTIGGGSGQYSLLFGLKTLAEVEICSIVSMADSGGSTGRLRAEIGVLPPGDLLKCLLALSEHGDFARDVLLTRFNGNSKLTGHNAGNFLLAALSQYAGLPEAIEALSEILRVKGRILPVTLDQISLVAELTNGQFLYGEAAIDVPRGDQRERIARTFLVPHHGELIKVYPPVLSAIAEADFVVIGPGDIFTSITPNFLIPGVKEALMKTKAKLIYPVNIMTKFGESDNFSGEDFVHELEEYLGRQVDFVLFNTAVPEKELLKKYERQKAYLVGPAEFAEGQRNISARDLLSTAGDIIRHDSAKLAAAIKQIIR